MSLQILTTKIGIPVIRSEQVARPRLSERLDETLRYPLTIVTAPAGFGKTTLLSAWARRAPVAWVSLEPGDSDPVRFWAYCVSALQSIQPAIGREALKLLYQPDNLSPESFLVALLNDLARQPDHLILVLDDFHVLHDRMVLEGISFWVEHLPPTVHLLLASRIEPPIPLARLRARGQLLELHAADLRFTLSETAAFLNESMRLNLSGEQAAALDGYTEGWAAALQLVALSIQRSANAASFIQSFTGDRRSPLALVEYLAGEVLNQQSPAIRDFLLRTSVLRQLSPSLCQAVTGQENSREILVSLVKSNLFVVQLDDTQQVYRYHHLFADFLRGQLRAENPDAEWESCRRASGWYARNGMPAEAIDYALDAHDYDRAVALLEQIGQRALHLGVSVSQRWFQSLPEPILLSHPTLTLHYAWLLVILNQQERAERYLQSIASNDLLAGEIATLRAFAAARQGNLSQTVELSRLALEHLPEDDRGMRSVTSLTLASLNLWSGNWDAAREALASIDPGGSDSKNQHFKAAFLSHWGLLHLLEGHYQQAWESLQPMLSLAYENEPFNGIGYLGTGEILREWNRLDEAEQALRLGLDKIGPIEGDGIRAFGYLSLARLYAARGEMVEAATYFEEAEEAARRAEARLLIAEVAARRAQWELAHGRLQTAGNFAVEQIAQARTCIAQKKPDRAAALLSQLVPQTVQNHVEMLTLQALLAPGIDPLLQALELAEPEGYIRLFVDEGPALIGLLRRVYDRQRKETGAEPSPEYVRQILLAFNAAQTPPSQPESLIDPLSARELDVLRLMAEGLSNEDIAAHLVISVGTARKHASNIFSKLDAHSRIEAVTRARKLNLLN